MATFIENVAAETGARMVAEETSNPHMAIMGREGDTKIEWDRDSREEVAAARAAFEKLQKRGYAAYSVDRSGNQGALLREFDPAAQRIIMAKPLVGG